MMNRFYAVAGVAVAIGIAAGGWFVGAGIEESRKYNRFVTVKGLSERVVLADYAEWRLQFSATSDKLEQAQQKLQQDTLAIYDFLESHGIDRSQAKPDWLQVIDRHTQHYKPHELAQMDRYVVNKMIVVQLDDISLVKNAAQNVGDLLLAGVSLSSANGPSYLFTSLNELKPQMIAEATTYARRSAEQFAQDSGSTVGAIRRANQGVFSIRSRTSDNHWDESQSAEKIVRVVSTIEFSLDD